MRLLVHTCSIMRKQKVLGRGLTSEWATILNAVKCLVLPATTDDTLSDNVVVGKDYIVYCEADTDVRKGDKLHTSTGLTLLVKGVADYKDVPNVSHIELSCETEDD